MIKMSNRPGPAPVPDRIADTKFCHQCRTWIESPHGRRELDAHVRAEHPTVAKIDIEGRILDTLRSETELNGWQASQAALFDRGAPRHHIDERQAALL